MKVRVQGEELEAVKGWDQEKGRGAAPADGAGAGRGKSGFPELRSDYVYKT